MRTYSTCTTCGDLMHVTEHRQRVHPSCEDQPDYATRLENEYVHAATVGDDKRATELERTLDQLDAAPPRLLDAALAYAAWGWPVFPLRPGRKDPWQGSRGFKDATTDIGTIRAWWKKEPASNVGLATGGAFDVLDVDVPAGILEWAEYRDSNRAPDAHGIVTTPSGGLHAYVLPTGGGNLTKFLPGLDYRGRGGYVVAPPSQIDSGHGYMWSTRPSTEITAHAAALAG